MMTEEELNAILQEIQMRYTVIIMNQAIINSVPHIRTGNLISSYEVVEDDSQSVSIINNCTDKYEIEYFPFVEARFHMLGDAISQYEDMMWDEMAEAAQEYMEEQIEESGVLEIE